MFCLLFNVNYFTLILAHKEDRARIRVEHIVREDFLVEAYELLEMYCDLLLARFGLIQSMKYVCNHDWFQLFISTI